MHFLNLLSIQKILSNDVLNSFLALDEDDKVLDVVDLAFGAIQLME